MTDNNIETKCCYCENATSISDTEKFICNKKGVVGYNFQCNKFIFDPIKLSPSLPAKPLQFTQEDFKLES